MTDSISAEQAGLAHADREHLYSDGNVYTLINLTNNALSFKISANMEKDDSILGRARASIEAKKIGGKQIALVTEHLFETEVKPLLEQIATDFLERRIPPIFFPLIEEVKEFIEEKEEITLKSTQDIFYFYEKEAFTLNDIVESWKGDERKTLVSYFENNTLLEKLGVAVRVKLSGLYGGENSRYNGYLANAGFICFNNNGGKYYSDRLVAHFGSGDNRWDAKTNSEEEMNELIEKIIPILDSQTYLTPEHLAKIQLF